MTAERYLRRTRLRHHAGSVWQVIRYAENGDYRIRCVVGTRREGWIGGEEEGRVCQVHHDYLHGDDWTAMSDKTLEDELDAAWDEVCRLWAEVERLRAAMEAAAMTIREPGTSKAHEILWIALRHAPNKAASQEGRP